MNEKKDKKKSIFERWNDFIRGRSETRPEPRASYGSGMDRVDMKLPKSVELQLKLVNMMHLMDEYPNDWSVQVNFFKEIAPFCTVANQIPTMDMLGYIETQELITMYADLLLRPLSQRAATRLQQTIATLLPTRESAE